MSDVYYIIYYNILITAMIYYAGVSLKNNNIYHTNNDNYNAAAHRQRHQRFSFSVLFVAAFNLSLFSSVIIRQLLHKHRAISTRTPLQYRMHLEHNNITLITLK